jgi:hypothetical protein
VLGWWGERREGWWLRMDLAWWDDLGKWEIVGCLR